MKRLDHTVLRVANKQESAHFYQEVLGFRHEGEVGPFDVLRINEYFTLDLIQEKPRDTIHLAFAMDPTEFDDVTARLRANGIRFGNGPHNRTADTPAPAVGAKGMANALYFDDPDGHILEIRRYD